MSLGLYKMRFSSFLSWQDPEKSTRASTAYAPLVADAARSEDDVSVHNQLKQYSKHSLKKFIIFGLIFLFGVLLGIVVGRFPRKEIIQCNVSPNTGRQMLLYSPAQDAVQYEVHRFNASFRTDITKYQGSPTEEIDKNWEDLYRYGVNQIPASEAKKLVDKTVPIPGDEDNYIVTLEVFHQLHCLNLLRKSLYPDYYSTTRVDHLDHCVDILRQALTCTVDINPLSWYWYEPRHATETKLDGAHQCVDFGKIQEWAYEHRLQTAFDDSVNLQLGHDHHEHNDA